MPSLIDLFTPSFFMFLGITTLLIALVVVYFENKLREQNHKIISMVSLVSAMTDELNIIRSNISLLNTVNYENIGGLGGSSSQNDKIIFTPSLNPTINPSKIIISNNLIEVSDDDSEDEGDDDSDDEDVEDDDDSETAENVIGEDVDEDVDDSDSSDDESQNSVSNSHNEVIQIFEETLKNEDFSDLKILKLDALEKTVDFKNEPNLVFEHLDTDENQNQNFLGDNANDESNLLYENSEINMVSSADLKTINISEITDLEEFKHSNNDTTENTEIKKMSLNKLRNLVLEKGLSNEVSKLKKNDLLKLLGAE